MRRQVCYGFSMDTLPEAPIHAPAAPERVTPMMAQYIEIKAANPDCLLFYRMGDFYELFFEDAEQASRTLGIMLTKRGKHAGADIPMCGVPVERADDYLQRLIAAGHRVAVCEQLEDPAEAKKRGGKSVVRRDVVRLVTPGTITEDALLDPSRANILASVARLRASEGDDDYAVAAIDLSTGAFDVRAASRLGLSAELARLDPSEIIVSDALFADEDLREVWRDLRAAVTPTGLDGLDVGAARQRLCRYFSLGTLDGLGAFSRAGLCAAAMIVAYVDRTQRGTRAPLSPPRFDARNAALQIDAATRANLELTRTLGGERKGSLLEAIDDTVSPAGSRLLAEWLAGPLTDVAAIAHRHEGVAWFVNRAEARDALRRSLRQLPDMARALTRLAMDRGGPRDLAQVRDGLAAAAEIAGALGREAALPRILCDAAAVLDALDPLLEASLRGALADDLPLKARDGGFVREGAEPELDDLRALRDESRRVIAALQTRYAGETQCRTLRIKHNHFLGYFVEVPQEPGERFLKEPLNATFIHRQTMAGAMRFSTAELSALEAKIASAGDRALAHELAVFDRLVAETMQRANGIKAAAAMLAVLDVVSALAALAEKRGWVRPSIDDGIEFHLEAARHPVVERALAERGESFIANDCDLSGAAGAGGRILLITGPNMAGKSTFLRQNALIVVLAQMGAFVPARAARIGVVDKLFSRVGAADDLARGRSTFMVEMVETAAILNQATPRSLVILDEIGRGTATFDGLSIAWATIENLHHVNRSRALFATHYHELTALASRLERLSNVTMRVAEWNGDVVFLHEVVAGSADRSYGIQVAKLAGLPPAVIERARHILKELESADRERPVQKLVDDLPLFAAARPSTPVAEDPLRMALAELKPDEMSPREALDALYRLRALQSSA
ncbi:MAG: DNA mismatch repair protein MutS [Beijerinckiaceae bacterium]|nr:DNA mismatch repair protein MutS [Beijerinckiaceae bacterium]